VRSVAAADGLLCRVEVLFHDVYYIFRTGLQLMFFSGQKCVSEWPDFYSTMMQICHNSAVYA